MTNALMLDGWEVREIRIVGDARHAAASCRAILDACPKCGVVGRLYRHGTKSIKYRDAPAFGKQVVIIADVQRYRCRECKETSMQPLPEMDTQRRMTKRCVEYIGAQGVFKTFYEVAREIGVDEKTVRNICRSGFNDALKKLPTISPIILGIDEVYLKEPGRRHKRRCSVFSDIIGGTGYVDMIDGGNVRHWLYKRPDKDRIKVVLMDMCEAYRQAVIDVLPGTYIVVDRFHVAKKLNEALDAVRNTKRRHALHAAEQDGRRLPRIKRGDRNILQMSRHNLSPRMQFKLDGILRNNPLFKAAWDAKEAFYDIWDAKTRQEAERLFDVWAANIPPLVERQFRPVAAMVERWREEIFAYWTLEVTNAYTESLNRMVKDMNREGRGYSFRTIRAKALLRVKIEHYTKCRSCKDRKLIKHMRTFMHQTAPPDRGILFALCKKCVEPYFHTLNENDYYEVST